MFGFILGQKSQTTQAFSDKGDRIPVTFIKTGACYLVGIKTPEKNNYFSLKLGFGKARNIKKPQLGELKKAGITTPLRFLKEFRIKAVLDESLLINENNKQGITIGESKIFIGDEIKPALLFKDGDFVTVSGRSKGKGFQGAMKRHGFSGGPKTHGQSDRWRAPGSIGSATTPGRVMKGKRMAGRTGGVQVTVKNLEVIEVVEDGLLLKGLVPGPQGGLLEVKTAK